MLPRATVSRLSTLGRRGFAYLPRDPVTGAPTEAPFIRTRFGSGRLRESFNQNPGKFIGCVILVFVGDTLLGLIPYVGKTDREWWDDKQTRMIAYIGRCEDFKARQLEMRDQYLAAHPKPYSH
eukprot:gb/GEZN01015862.1/.p2 GENE.gb/GEZN01015862.1/~~gb/GEZN01015862.1/.p2  ORF type:complete len:123 (-),score=12.42 gb/GEZN01015862.1/:293-661(-)